MVKKQTVDPRKGAYQISVSNQQKCLPVCDRDVSDSVYSILKSQNVSKAILSVVIVTDRAIKGINRRFLGKNYSTDVIAFDLKEKKAVLTEKSLDGEIYVSAVTARRVAKHYHMTAEQELILYIAHGILHLLGYDDHTAAERKVMRAKEQEILDFIQEIRRMV